MQRSDTIKYRKNLDKSLASFSSTILLLLILNFISQVIYCQPICNIPDNSNSSSWKNWKQVNSNELFHISRFFQEPENPITYRRPQTKSGTTSGLRLDSIIEIKSDGFYDRIHRWYFKYDALNRLDTISVYYFDEFGRFEKIIEKSYFNKSGQITRFVRRQPDPWRTYLYDSTMIDFIIKEFEYRDDFLVEETTSTWDYQSYIVRKHILFYNDIGKLAIDSSYYQEEFNGYYEYFYNTEGELEYVMFDYFNYYEIQKNVYSATDTSRLINEKYVFYCDQPEKPLLDTISVWRNESLYHEIYDQRGRITSLILEEYGNYTVNGKVYKAVYSWTGFDSLLHASYFDWESTEESGTWQEAMRIDKTYDEYGNLLIYEKTFFDARTESWEIYDQKNYFYSAMPNGLPTCTTESDNIIIYPNPAGEVIHLELPFPGNFYYSLYNLYGVCLARSNLENYKIDVSRLNPGIYIVEVSNGHSRFSELFIKND